MTSIPLMIKNLSQDEKVVIAFGDTETKTIVMRAELAPGDEKAFWLSKENTIIVENVKGDVDGKEIPVESFDNRPQPPVALAPAPDADDFNEPPEDDGEPELKPATPSAATPELLAALRKSHT